MSNQSQQAWHPDHPFVDRRPDSDSPDTPSNPDNSGGSDGVSGTGGVLDIVDIGATISTLASFVGLDDVSVDTAISLDSNGDGGDSGQLALNIDGGSGVHLDAPLFGDASLLGAGSSDGEGSSALISLDGSDAVVQIPLLEAEASTGAADFGSLLNASMLTLGDTPILTGVTGGDVYDGSMPLVGDVTSALGSTLDLLTTTTSLFDVPVLDILGGDNFDG